MCVVTSMQVCVCVCVCVPMTALFGVLMCPWPGSSRSAVLPETSLETNDLSFYLFTSFPSPLYSYCSFVSPLFSSRRLFIPPCSFLFSLSLRLTLLIPSCCCLFSFVLSPSLPLSLLLFIFSPFPFPLSSFIHSSPHCFT